MSKRIQVARPLSASLLSCSPCGSLVHVIVSAHAKSLGIFSKPHCGKIAHQVFCVLSKILYDMGYMLQAVLFLWVG